MPMLQGFTEAWRKRPEYLTSGLPYIIHPDYMRLVRLVREWKRETAHPGASTPSLKMISAQCESLYFRVYGTVCYFSNVPKEMLPEKYW